MDLTKVNHVITEVKSMLTALVEAEVISDPEARSLLPGLVLKVLQNESVVVEGV